MRYRRIVLKDDHVYTRSTGEGEGRGLERALAVVYLMEWLASD